jgi:integrase
MFCRPDGEYLTPSNFGKGVSKLMRSAGLAGITLHSLRHSQASELLSQGAPITAVAERLGHASPNITFGIYRTLCRMTTKPPRCCGTTRWQM